MLSAKPIALIFHISPYLPEHLDIEQTILIQIRLLITFRGSNCDFNAASLLDWTPLEQVLCFKNKFQDGLHDSGEGGGGEIIQLLCKGPVVALWSNPCDRGDVKHLKL